MIGLEKLDSTKPGDVRRVYFTTENKLISVGISNDSARHLGVGATGAGPKVDRVDRVDRAGRG